MNEIFENLYDMTAFSNIIAEPQFLIMYAIAFVLLYLGIKKQYEPLLLVPIAFGVLLANFPGGDMGVIQADENGMVMINGVMKNIWEMPLHDIAHELGLMNFIYYMLIKTGFLPPIIFMGVGALTDFGPMLRNLRLSIFGAAAQLGIFTVLLVSILMGFTPKEAASLGIIGGADGPTVIYVSDKKESQTPTGYPSDSVQRPQIMYDGAIYLYGGSSFDGSLPQGCVQVGSVQTVDNANAPAEDFAGSRVEAGQKLYALPGNSGSIYVEYTDGFAEFVLAGASK